MKIIIILLLLIKVAYFFKPNLTNRVNQGLMANGVPYDTKKYPYVVCIELIEYHPKFFSTVTCTGSLIKELYVLTAAHCIRNYSSENVKVFLGSKTNNNYRKVAEMYAHPSYKFSEEKEIPMDCDDIGVMKLKKPFSELKQYVQIGGHPKEFENLTPLKCILIGFGRTEDKAVGIEGDMGIEGKMITIDVKHGPRACQAADSPQIKDYWKEFLCPVSTLHKGKADYRGGKMICKGDSGGPMICNDKIYGVASFVYEYYGKETVCGGPNMQSVHTFIHYHLAWVNSIVDPGANKKKKKKKNSGNLLKLNPTLHTILTILLYSVLTII